MFPKSIKTWLVVVAIAIGGWYFVHQRTLERRMLASGPVGEAPVQQSTREKAFDVGGFRIQPVASYDIRAKVLSTERYRMGREAELSPVDFALGWGPMSDQAVLSQLQISQGGRWYEYRWDNQPPIEPGMMARHSANTHLIPANSSVKKDLLNIERGQVVRLRGMLVNVEHTDGWKWFTSTTRDDTGGGACELMWVTEVVVE